MNTENLVLENGFQWEADSRYFEKKPASYFRAITVLAILINLLLFFFKEVLLIILVWLVYFVVYVRSIVPPVKTKYKLDRFGITYYAGHIAYKQIAAFCVIKRKKGLVLRLVLQPSQLQYDLVLPTETQQSKQVIAFLKEKTPYLEELPKTEIEKLGGFLGKITGLDY